MLALTPRSRLAALGSSMRSPPPCLTSPGDLMSPASATQIDKDVRRSNLKADLTPKLRSVLRRCCALRPQYGYCQGMNLVAAQLLTFAKADTNKATALLLRLADSLPADYWSPSLSGQRELAASLVSLAQTRRRGLRLHGSQPLQLRGLALGWFGSVFAGALPDAALATLLALLLEEAPAEETNTPLPPQEERAATTLLLAGLAIVAAAEAELVAAAKRVEDSDLSGPLVGVAAALTPEALERAVASLRRETPAKAVRRAREAARAEVLREDEELRLLRRRALETTAEPPAAARERKRKAGDGASSAAAEADQEDEGRAKQPRLWGWAFMSSFS